MKSIKLLNTRSVSHNVIIANFGAIANKVLMFAFVILISRHFGAEEFGYYGTANTYSIIIITFLSFGSNFLLTREVAADKEQSAYYFKNIFQLRLVFFIGVALFIGTLLIFMDYPDELKVMIVLFMFVGLVRAILQQTFSFYQGLNLFSLQVIIEASAYFLLIIGAVLVLWFKLNIEFIGIVLLFAFGLAMLCSIVVANRRLLGESLLKGWDYKEMIGVLKQSLPFFFGSILGILYHRMGILILGWEDGQQSVGMYVAPYNLYEAFLFIPATIGNVLFPTFVKQILNKNYDYISKNLNGIIYFIVLTLTPILVILLMGGHDIVDLLFGSKYKGAGTILQIVSLGLIFHTFNNILGRLLYALNQEVYQLKITIVALVLNIILNIILIPYFSYSGVAISAISSFFVSFLLHFFRVKYLLKGIRIIIFKRVLNFVLYLLVSFLIFWGLSQFIDSIIVKGLVLCFLHYCFVYIFELEVKNYIKQIFKI